MAKILGFFFSFLFISAVSSYSVDYNLEDIQTEYEANVIRITEEGIQQNIYEITKTFLIHALSQKAPIFDPFPDPLNITDGENTFDSDIIRGTLKNWDSEILGLSTIVENLQILPLPPTVKYNFDVETVNFHGMYDADLLLFNEMNFTGSGAFGIELGKGFLDLVVKFVVLPGNLSIGTLEVGFGFDTLELYAENSFFNGEPMDWADISAQIREIFENYYPTIIDVFIPMVKTIINALIKDCTIADIIAGDFTCIGYDPPTTTAPQPTNAPTENPTNAPTGNPTNAPTGNPTNGPTGNPTNAPTEAPTDAPTENPTSDPDSTTENSAESLSNLRFIGLFVFSIIAKYVMM